MLLILATNTAFLYYDCYVYIELQSVAEASKNLSAACIIVISKTGQTAMNISKFRPRIPIVTIVPNAKAGRLLQVGWENDIPFRVFAVCGAFDV